MASICVLICFICLCDWFVNIGCNMLIGIGISEFLIGLLRSKSVLVVFNCSVLGT